MSKLFSAEIPVQDADHAKQLMYTLDKMNFAYTKVWHGRRIIGFVVAYNEPIDLFYLGATAVADTVGIFKSALTI